MWGVISIVFGAIDLVIGLRFVFQLIGANVSSAFVSWIYNVSSPLVAPFTGIFGDISKPIAGAIPHSVFEPATLIALLVYGLIGGVVLRVVTRPRD
ncbi:MAG: YggT family protein [Candidatus Saccharimonadales bacterium]